MLEHSYINKFAHNLQIVSYNLIFELSNFKVLLNYSYFPILPILLPILITMVMFLPQNIQDSLKLHYHNPQWWQLLTNAFVHLNFDHYLGNIAILILLLLLQLILVTMLKENKRYYLLLLATIILVPILTSLVELYYTFTNTNVYNVMQTGCGISGVVFAIFGFIPILSLAYFSKLIEKNLLNTQAFLSFIGYIGLAFIVMASFFLHIALTTILAIIFLMALIILITMILIQQGNDYRNALSIIVKDWLFNKKNIITNTVLLTLILLFIVTPWQLLPNVFVVNGGFIDFTAHFIGLMLGVFTSYFIFLPRSS